MLNWVDANVKDEFNRPFRAQNMKGAVRRIMERQSEAYERHGFVRISSTFSKKELLSKPPKDADSLIQAWRTVGRDQSVELVDPTWLIFSMMGN